VRLTCCRRRRRRRSIVQASTTTTTTSDDHRLRRHRRPPHRSHLTLRGCVTLIFDPLTLESDHTRRSRHVFKSSTAFDWDIDLISTSSRQPRHQHAVVIITITITSSSSSSQCCCPWVLVSRCQCLVETTSGRSWFRSCKTGLAYITARLSLRRLMARDFFVCISWCCWLFAVTISSLCHSWYQSTLLLSGWFPTVVSSFGIDLEVSGRVMVSQRWSCLHHGQQQQQQQQQSLVSDSCRSGVAGL